MRSAVGISGLQAGEDVKRWPAKPRFARVVVSASCPRAGSLAAPRFARRRSHPIPRASPVDGSPVARLGASVTRPRVGAAAQNNHRFCLQETTVARSV